MEKRTMEELQRELRGRFPGAIRVFGEAENSGGPEFDWENPETFPVGGITEVVPARPASGLSLYLARLLAGEPAATGEVPELALIDGRDAFDPTAFTVGDCAKLLWIRCQSPEQSIQAADILLRDGNVPRVVLDLSGFTAAEAGRIRASSWHRLRSLVEAGQTRLTVFSPCPLVPCAVLRLGLEADFSLEHLSWPREDLFMCLRVSTELSRRRTANGC